MLLCPNVEFFAIGTLLPATIRCLWKPTLQGRR